jgi:UDP-3-O-[3-hydroxymyristoyl] glucosamine N-acyltransferase
MTSHPLAELAALLGARLVGDGAIEITGVAGLREARRGDVTFLVNPRYEAYLKDTGASAVLVAEPRADCALAQLVAADPYFAFLKAVKIFRQERPRPPVGVHPTAVLGPGVVLGHDVSIGPHAVIEEGAVLGDRVVVLAQVYVGHRVQVGDDCFLYPQVVVREDCRLGARVVLHSNVTVGADGFGYARNEGSLFKVPQVGNVVLEDDVEVGAGTCIDRATTGTTRIGEGTKIDNLVQIGHNVELGRHVIVAAMSGIAGSTRIADDVTIGAQAGVTGHITIGEGATVASRGGVTKSVPARAVVSGVLPARPHGIERRIQASIARLPQLVQRILRLEQRVAELAGDPPAAATDGKRAPAAERKSPPAPAPAADPAPAPAESRR